MLARTPSLVSAAFALSSAVSALLVPGKLIDQVRVGGNDVHATNSWTYTDCGLPTDAVQVHSIKVSPDPPQIGKDLTITASGYVGQKIEDGAYADVTVKLGLIKLLHKQFDVCEEARNNNVTVQCPVEPGEYVVMQTVTLPKETPKAKFVIDIKGFTSEEALDPDLVCLQLRVDFLGRPWLTI
ncbi:Phosphatidylglycerol/phosphatidylinositol transfer protein [Ceratobasidium sp. 428]|nr:Phosphatidylglycerol/phosphatidylinositol transfer protein [Ceratobasidium sp. 428]